MIGKPVKYMVVVVARANKHDCGFIILIVCTSLWYSMGTFYTVITVTGSSRLRCEIAARCSYGRSQVATLSCANQRGCSCCHCTRAANAVPVQARNLQAAAANRFWLGNLSKQRTMNFMKQLATTSNGWLRQAMEPIGLRKMSAPL